VTQMFCTAVFNNARHKQWGRNMDSSCKVLYLCEYGKQDSLVEKKTSTSKAQAMISNVLKG